jgi:SAM-dependent methyltransferase
MRRLLRRLLRRGGLPVYADDEHPERVAVLQHAQGRVVEIGCGYRKTSGDYIGVDMVPGGEPGRVGNVKGKASQADVASLGDRLPFRNDAFDTVVARHNLEHYVDLVGVLREWRRVAGRLVAVVPDEERYAGSTLALDPTHYHAFSEAAVRSLFPLTGWAIDDVGPCIDGWSLLIVARRT